ncbi:MAG: pyruvate kinase alpha/beta domain-containing protein, partial [Candidatus Bathyarchaeia archaeon]
MGKIVREVYYFDEPGAQNTEDVLEAVMKYLKVNEIEYLIIASTSGKTALKFAEALKNKKIKVICVSEPPSRKIFGDQWPCINPETKNKLEALGADVIDRIPYKFHDSVLELAKWYVPIAEHIVGDTLAFVGGQGLKVAVEAMFMAVQAGCVEPDKEVVAVAGYGGGADTAIVVKTCFPETL